MASRSARQRADIGHPPGSRLGCGANCLGTASCGSTLLSRPLPAGLEPRIGRHNFYFNHTKGFFCLRNDTADKCLRETKGRRHPRVDPAVVTKLRKFFSEHNQRFYDLVGQDLGWPEE